MATNVAEALEGLDHEKVVGRAITGAQLTVGNEYRCSVCPIPKGEDWPHIISLKADDAAQPTAGPQPVNLTVEDPRLHARNGLRLTTPETLQEDLVVRFGSVLGIRNPTANIPNSTALVWATTTIPANATDGSEATLPIVLPPGNVIEPNAQIYLRKGEARFLGHDTGGAAFTAETASASWRGTIIPANIVARRGLAMTAAGPRVVGDPALKIMADVAATGGGYAALWVSVRLNLERQFADLEGGAPGKCYGFNGWENTLAFRATVGGVSPTNEPTGVTMVSYELTCDRLWYPYLPPGIQRADLPAVLQEIFPSYLEGEWR